ncbi:hypothetical protein [Desulfobacula toluolica]|uniref:Lipoprotein n=1 Tax=Desulfobacula toluolica (strain DSM 7467 / Tol2) TaxID=651182 RepID=K0NFP4_DESTT|nr:hypothetical protein [Desulfobacula toluolica]CCK78523.1 uncharacterized protein TOL2_C03530 [Desulfobacula toluolica Tol2]
MKSRFFLYALLIFCFGISACQNEKEENNYSKVSELISERNKARYEMSETPSKMSGSNKKVTTSNTNILKTKSDSKKEEFLSIILYEEGVEIVSSESQRTLAKGIAYINKKGQIVKIKLLKE